MVVTLFFLSVCLSFIHLVLDLSVRVFVCLSFWQSIFLSVCQSLSVSPFVFSHIFIFFCLTLLFTISVYLSICVVWLYVFLLVYLSFPVFSTNCWFCRSVCLRTCLNVCIYAYVLFNRWFFYLFFWQSWLCLS